MVGKSLLRIPVLSRHMHIQKGHRRMANLIRILFLFNLATDIDHSAHSERFLRKLKRQEVRSESFQFIVCGSFF